MAKQSDILLDSDELKVLTVLERRLETILSCETKVMISPYKSELLNLIIEIRPNYSLSELITLFKLPNFSNNWTILNSLILKFKKEIVTLSNDLTDEYDIREVYITLKNTSITISSIYKNSIVNDIIFIIYSIIQHFDNYTNMGEVPSAIHLPIFEDLTIKEILDKNDRLTTNFLDSPYSKFWGMHFEHMKKPMIYDLIHNCLIQGDIDLNLE